MFAIFSGLATTALEVAVAVVAATMVVAVAAEAVVTAAMAMAAVDEVAVGATTDVDLLPPTAVEAMVAEVVDEVPATLVRVLARTPLVSMVPESPVIPMVMLTEC